MIISHFTSHSSPHESSQVAVGVENSVVGQAVKSTSAALEQETKQREGGAYFDEPPPEARKVRELIDYWQLELTFLQSGYCQ